MYSSDLRKQEQRRSVRQLNYNQVHRTQIRDRPSDAAIHKASARYREPRTLTSRLMGDPAPSQSALGRTLEPNE
jgi:hypothetical protein